MKDKRRRDRYAQLLAHADTLEGLQRAANKKVRRKTRSGFEEITKQEALLQKVMDDALTGGSHSVGLCLRLLAEAAELWEFKLEEDHQIWMTVKRRNQRAIDAAHEAGASPPDVFPHPDDIIIEPNQPARLEGPLTRDDQTQLRELLNQREAYMIEDALVRAREKRRNDPAITPWGPAFMAMFIDRSLPKRLRWGEIGFINAREAYNRFTERELSKMRRTAWANLGVKLRRDQTLSGTFNVEEINPILAQTIIRAMREDNPEDVIEEIWMEELEAAGLQLKNKSS